VLEEPIKKASAWRKSLTRIARNLKKVKHSRLVFASSLVAPLGKALMAACYPKARVPSPGRISKSCENMAPEVL